MATVTITNLTNRPVLIQDLYTSVLVGGSVVVERAASDLPGMSSLQAALAAGDVSIDIAYSSIERASGLEQAAKTVGGDDIRPVAAADILSACQLIRVVLAPGEAGGADDVEVLAVGSQLTNMRVVDSWVFVSIAIGATTVELRTAAGGAGTLISSAASAVTGRFQMDPDGDVSILADTDGADGLFIRRSDKGVEGEAFVLLRPEQ